MTNRQGGLPCPFNSLRKKRLAARCVSPWLNQDIEHITVLIDGTPEILPLTLDRDEDFVRDTTCRPDGPVAASRGERIPGRT